MLLVGDSAQHRSVERGDALRILEESGSVRYVELLQTHRQKVPALKAAIEDLKAGRLQAGWEKLEQHGVIKEVAAIVELRERAFEQHLESLRAGKTSLVISPRHDEARKVANQNEKQKDTVSRPGITKEVVGIHVRLTHSLFASDIPRRLLRRVSRSKPTSAPARF